MICWQEGHFRRPVPDHHARIHHAPWLDPRQRTILGHGIHTHNAEIFVSRRCAPSSVGESGEPLRCELA